jgi:predicted nucleotidyltransferase
MLKTTTSPTSTMTLDEVIGMLASQDRVEGVLLMGSAVCGEVGPASDYDMVVVLSELPDSLHSGLVYVDGRLTDLFFVAVQDVVMLLEDPEPVAAASWPGLLVRWLTTGRIAFDRSGHLESARRAVRDAALLQPTTPGDAYSTWYKINYDLRHNKRMLNSDDPVYLLAVDIRLLYSLADVLVGYFTLRGLLWQGEKKAIRYWSAHDPNFVALFQAYSAETDRGRKLHLYEQMAALTTEPLGGLWPANASMFRPLPGSETPSHDAEQALLFWNRLFEDAAQGPVIG